jgi:hypothetical protein
LQCHNAKNSKPNFSRQLKIVDQPFVFMINEALLGFDTPHATLNFALFNDI